MSRAMGIGRLLLGGLAVAALAAGAASGPGAASAAVPDQFGFVLWNGGAVDPTGTTPPGTSVGVGGVGQYKIDFVGAAAKGGVLHVTAINPAPHWCQVNSFGPSGPDEIATISCYQVGGALDYTDFSAVFGSSTGPIGPGAFGYVNALPGGSLVSQYNSSGAGNSVAHVSTGVWQVKFPGLSTPGPIDGSLQATAISPVTVPARCKIFNWSSSPSGQFAQVNCYDPTGAPFDTQFDLTYQYQRALWGGYGPPKYFGYLWNQPVGGPASTNYNNPLGPGANSMSPGPLASVKFYSLAVLPDDLQVTAAGQGSDFCGLDKPWQHFGSDTVAQNVNCFTNAGAPIGSGFLISDNSAN